MVEWLSLSDNRKNEILNRVSIETGLLPNAIEKDWWVTLALKAIFSTRWKENLVFKGGTSLSKAWSLIERFSEDIDLAIDRQVLGFSEEFVSKTQVTKLRKAASAFIATGFKDELQATLLAMGVPTDQFQLTVQETDVSDRDPQVLELAYHSAVSPESYLPERVLIEIGARSLREPSSSHPITTLLYQVFPKSSFSGEPFTIPVVDPKRTFLEKIFLIYEEFSKEATSIRHERMSRHLYDLERMMDTDHGISALEDQELFQTIVQHRSTFTRLNGIDYERHQYRFITIVPPDEIVKQWEADYIELRRVMIYGPSLNFTDLVGRLSALQERIRRKGPSLNAQEPVPKRP